MADVSDAAGAGRTPQSAGEYCREVEAYLCRKNDGHLVRIAGPSFARVCGWADRGVPLKVVFRGIDRYFERYYSRGPRRRPVHIDFCEHDVLDVFDHWRRAVGVHAAGTSPDAVADPSPTHPSLPAHLERVVVRLTTLRAGGRLTPGADATIADATRELDGARGRAGHLRGDARAALIARLSELDALLVAAISESIGNQERQAMDREARDDLAPFRGGMSDQAYERAVQANVARLLRERTGLPVVAYDQ